MEFCTRRWPAGDDIVIPDDLESRILDQLEQNPSWRWDAAVAEIAADQE
jgi:hypothetical protein